MLSIALSAFSGALLALALPPFPAPWLAWAAPACLFLAVRKASYLRAFEYGVLAAVTCGAVYLRDAMFSGFPNPALTPFGCLSIFLGLACMLAVFAWRRWEGTRAVLFMACAGVALEWLTTFSPLPLHLALTQQRSLPLIQIASITGIWGVSFLIWLFNAALADGIATRRWRTPSAALAAGAMVLALGYGAFLLAGTPPRATLRVAAVQDYGGEVGDAWANRENLPDRETLTRTAVRQGAQLVVWPEECLGRSFTPGEPEDPSARFAREHGLYLVVGYEDAGSPKDFNCAALLSPQGETLGVHEKVHLYMGERNAIQSGTAARAWNTPVGRMGMEICFDSCYTGVTRRIARKGARLIAMPNFDPPVSHGVLHYLHAAVLPFRAVENRVAFIRADTNGLSQVIAPDGRVVGQSGLWTAEALVRDLPLGAGRGTFFTRWGDWVAYLCAAAVALLLLTAALPRRANQPAPDVVSCP